MRRFLFPDENGLIVDGTEAGRPAARCVSSVGVWAAATHPFTRIASNVFVSLWLPYLFLALSLSLSSD